MGNQVTTEKKKEEGEKKVRKSTRKFSLRKKKKKEGNSKTSPASGSLEALPVRKAPLSTIFEETEDNYDLEQRKSRRSSSKFLSMTKIEKSKVDADKKSGIKDDLEDMIVEEEQKSTSEVHAPIENGSLKPLQPGNDFLGVSEAGTEEKSEELKEEPERKPLKEPEREPSDLNGVRETNEEYMVSQEEIEDFIDKTGSDIVDDSTTYGEDISKGGP